MTVWEEYNRDADLMKHRHDDEQNTLLLHLREKQEICGGNPVNHKYGPVQPEMFYAMGETASGKECTECGVEHHAEPTQEAEDRMNSLKDERP